MAPVQTPLPSPAFFPAICYAASNPQLGRTVYSPNVPFSSLLCHGSWMRASTLRNSHCIWFSLAEKIDLLLYVLQISVLMTLSLEIYLVSQVILTSIILHLCCTFLPFYIFPDWEASIFPTVLSLEHSTVLSTNSSNIC